MSAITQKHNVTEVDCLVWNYVSQMFASVTTVSQHAAIT